MTGLIDNSTVQKEGNQGGFERCSHTLLSKERVQKLNLLLHLISNISGPIVVRGPDGIGKSTMLKEVKSHSLDSWVVCLVEALPDLSLDGMRQMLGESASCYVKSSLFADSADSLGEQLNWMEENSRLLVLLLDDADTVAPGLLQFFRQFSEAHPALRLVYAMKPEDLQVMDVKCADIGDCFFVDLPPLTEQQCGEFIDNLSIDPQRPDFYPAKASALIHRVYKKTHGVPGEILKILPTTPKMKSRGEKNKIILGSVLILSVIGLLVWASSFQDQLFSREPTLSQVDGRGKKTILSGVPSVSGIMAVGESDSSRAVVEKGIKSDNITETRISQGSDNHLTVKAPRVAIPKLKESLSLKKTLFKEKTKQQRETVMPLQTSVDQLRENAPFSRQLDRVSPIASKKKSNGLGISGVKGAEWLLNQKPENWTVQLIAVSQLDALKSLIEKHSDLKLLAAIRSRAKGKDFFSLYYGSFNTVEEAKIAMNKLPPFFKKPWPIMFSVVHGKIKSQIN